MKSGAAGEGGLVRPVEGHVPARGPDPGHPEDIGQAHPAPAGRPHGPTIPLDARRLGGVEAAAVAGALQGHDLGHRLQLFQVVQAQGEGPVHLSLYLQRPLSRIEGRGIVIVPNEKAVGGGQPGGQLPERCLQIEGALGSDDQSFLAGDRFLGEGQRNPKSPFEQRRRCPGLNEEGTPGKTPTGCPFRLAVHGTPPALGTRPARPAVPAITASRSRNGDRPRGRYTLPARRWLRQWTTSRVLSRAAEPQTASGRPGRGSGEERGPEGGAPGSGATPAGGLRRSGSGWGSPTSWHS